jgi:DNA-directed RNA polymerase specialized sigma24 family protein
MQGNRKGEDQMATTFESLTGYTPFFPTANALELETCQAIYNQNKHRIYSLSFWMTDNELAAEELLQRAFTRAFTSGLPLGAEMIDGCLIAELREFFSLDEFTLKCGLVTTVCSVRRNTRRVDLERAVVQLPATEKMMFLLHDVERYDWARVARSLDLTVSECRRGVHQARLQIRQLLAKM